MCVADGPELFQYLNVGMGSSRDALLPFNHVMTTSKIAQLETHLLVQLGFYKIYEQILI